MRIAFVSAVSLTALALSACTKRDAPVTFDPGRMRAHVTFLADDLLEGRKTGTRGHALAARYVAAQFEGYGLQPAGENGGWFQNITFQRTEYVRDRAALTITGPAGTKRFAHGTNAMVSLNPQQLHFEVSAPLVFVGFGIQNERLKLDDYRDLDVRGKIVVTLSGFPKGLPSEEGAYVSSIKVQLAERLGAVGMISMRTIEREAVRPWKRSVAFAWDPEFNWVGPDGKVHIESAVIGSATSVDTIAAEAIFAGAPRTVAEVLREADQPGGVPRGFALQTQAKIEVQGKAERVTSPNVIGVLRGSDPTLAAQHVVLSAHLDHLGVSDSDPQAPDADRINNGALDNASGVATMLEVARAAAGAAQKPRRSILFLATTAEEEGLLGAEYYAHYPTVPIAQIVGNVDLDMPLLLYPFTDVVAFGADHSTLGPLVAKAAGTLNIALSPDPHPEQTIFVRSDHYMFVKQGVPAVYLATGVKNGGDKATEDFLAGPYHHPNDDLQQPIDWQAAARFADVNYRITREMADADEPPRWNEGDFFGDTFAPGALRRKP